jgi:hypothetical protein
MARPAAPARPAPSGFDFSHDIPSRSATPARAAQPARPAPERPTAPEHPGAPGDQSYHPPAKYREPSFTANAAGGPYRGRFTGRQVLNPRAPDRDWEWSHGVVWHPAPAYWGGGFWGAFALADLGGAVIYGAVEDPQNEIYYPSYQVDADTPGAEVLADYDLQQTQCGQPNLVVIWGPDNSVICALPNDSVDPNNYEIDPATLTLVAVAP